VTVDHDDLQRLVDDLLCPNALRLVQEASLGRCADGMLHCGLCGKPVLIRFGRVSLHGRGDEQIPMDIEANC
jgi:hypothetical protein